MLKQTSHFLQSEFWKNSKVALGQHVEELQSSYLFIKKLPIGANVGYFPRVNLAIALSQEAIQLYKKKNLTYVRIDPLDQKTNENVIKISEVNTKPGTAIQLPKTVIINLTKSEEELLSQMKQKHRYNLRLAEKKGVVVTIDDTEDSFKTFLLLYLRTVDRQQYVGRGEKYITTVWSEARKTDSVFIATAWYENEPIASWMLLTFEDSLYYPYGGTSDSNRNVMGTYKLVWEIIKWAKERNYRLFDLYGIEEDESDGFTRFKLGFVEKDPSQTVEYAQTIDVVLKPIRYRILRLIENMRNRFGFLKRI